MFFGMPRVFLQFFRRFPVFVFFKFGQEATGKEYRDYPLQPGEGDNRWRETDRHMETQQTQIAKAVSEEYEVWCGEVIKISICTWKRKNIIIKHSGVNISD